jgi:hypothetical protein
VLGASAVSPLSSNAAKPHSLHLIDIH